MEGTKGYILREMEKYPEGLTSREMASTITSKMIDRALIPRHMLDMANQNMLKVVDDRDRERVFVHPMHATPLSRVEKEYGRTPICEEDISRKDTIGFRGNTAYDVLKRLEKYTEPVSVKEFIEDYSPALSENVSTREYARILYLFNTHASQGLITRRQRGRAENGGASLEYIIEYTSPEAKEAIANREIGIAYLLRKYESYNLLLLEDGTIPIENSEEIIKCIQFVNKHHETSPKYIRMRVRATSGKKQIFRIGFYDKEFDIRFSDGTEPIKGAEACIAYIQNNTGRGIL